MPCFFVGWQRSRYFELNWQVYNELAELLCSAFYHLSSFFEVIF
jgi:hypothetical protein